MLTKIKLKQSAEIKQPQERIWSILELDFIPLPMAETMVHYQRFQRNKNKIASI